MYIARLKSFMIRHRTIFRDISILTITYLVVLYWTFGYEIFKNPDSLSVHQHSMKMEEALLFFGIMAFGILIWLRFELKRETARRLAAERLLFAYLDSRNRRS